MPRVERSVALQARQNASAIPCARLGANLPNPTQSASLDHGAGTTAQAGRARAHQGQASLVLCPVCKPASPAVRCARPPSPMRMTAQDGLRCSSTQLQVPGLVRPTAVALLSAFRSVKPRNTAKRCHATLRRSPTPTLAPPRSKDLDTHRAEARPRQAQRYRDLNAFSLAKPRNTAKRCHATLRRSPTPTLAPPRSKQRICAPCRSHHRPHRGRDCPPN